VPPIVVTTRQEVRQSLAGMRPGLVPTMGALHAGHLALIDRSARENPQTFVSIFVNPTQFGSQTDLERYPRDIERDASLAADAGATHIFVPSVEVIYPPGFDTWVDVGDLASRWEGVSRPGHFRGVATVVSILLNLVQPARTYFGEKDYQQLQIIRRMHEDLALSGAIVACETVRDRDGLALSSRNALLSNEDRQRARAIPRALDAVSHAAAKGERNVKQLESLGRSILEREDIPIDYLAIVDNLELKPLVVVIREARLLVSVELGGIRQIDNAAITVSNGEPT
jgi:pantoate--beta-alanine ligase